MNSNQENFEKLESFIDGELDAARRAQMEAEIGANPKLRKMVAELAATRVLVASLPRVPAPADLMETFQGRMERAVLLGDSAFDEPDDSMRISRWPQFMSIAAILLLSLGLAGVIYKILPQHRPSAEFASSMPPKGVPSSTVSPDGPKLSSVDEAKLLDPKVAVGVRGGLAVEELQKRNDTTSGGKSPGDTPAGQPGDKVADDSAMKFKDARDILANKPAAPDATDADARILALKKDGNGPPDLNNDRDRVAVDDLLRAQKALNEAAKILDGTAVAKASEREPMVVRVLAESPERANQDVTDFLVSNHIAYAALETPNQYGLSSGNLAVANSINATSSTANNSTANSSTGNLVSNNNANADEPARRITGENGDIGNGAAAGASGGRYAAASSSSPAAARGGGGGGGGGRGGASGGRGGGFGGGAAPTALAQGQVSASTFDNNRSATQTALNDKQQAFNQNGYSQTQPSSAESLGQTGNLYNGNQYGGGGFGAGNNGLNLRNNSVANGAYRARLTDRQLKDLNTRIASRGNQWVEEVLVTEAADSLPKETNTAGGVRQENRPGFDGGAGAATVTAADQSPPASAAAPSSPATRPAGAAPVMEPASAPQRQTMSRSIAEDAKDDSHVAAALPAAPATQGSFAKQEQLTLGGIEKAGEKFANEPSREVVIVVNEQPINLPVNLPPSTKPAGQTVSPTPSPATDTDVTPRESGK